MKKDKKADSEIADRIRGSAQRSDFKFKYDGKVPAAVFSEKGKKYTAKNNGGKEILGFQVDGGLYRGADSKKCDYCLVVQSSKFYLIELKGTDLSKACRQLLATVELFKEQYSVKDFMCRVILSKVNTHKVNNEVQRKLERKLMDICGKSADGCRRFVFA